jgi:hypothetical protein
MVAIGAPDNDGTGNRAGHVRVYQYASGTWVQLGADIDAEGALDQFGYSVSLSADGSIVAIGAPYNDDGGLSAGHVRVYQYTRGVWVKLSADIDGEAAQDYSGRSVSLSADGSIVAIGAGALDDNGTGDETGRVRVYQYVGGAWVQLGADIYGEAAGDYSGVSVSLSEDGTIVAIGAPFNDGGGDAAGHVRIYQYASGVWVQLGADIDGEVWGDRSGHSVSLSADGTIVAIGAPANDGNVSYKGHVRVYQYMNGTWVRLGRDIDGEAAWDWSGRSVSLSADGSIVAIGAGGNDGTGGNAGHVRVYGSSATKVKE